MTVDVPADVEAVLAQLFDEASEAFERGDVETGVSAVTTAATVTRNKLPESALREELLHGCERTEQVAADNDAVAAEYTAAMARRLARE